MFTAVFTVMQFL